MTKTIALPARLAVAVAAYFIGRDKQGFQVSLRSYDASGREITFKESNFKWDKEGALLAIEKACPKGWRLNSAISGTFWFSRSVGGIVEVDDTVWPRGEVKNRKKKKVP